MQLKLDAAQGLGMAFHELATNAGKYGALSTPEGRIRLTWTVTSEGAAQLFKIRWSEENGPPVKPCQRRGFGHTVMVEMAEYALNGEVTLCFRPAGLVWALSTEAGEAIEREEA